MKRRIYLVRLDDDVHDDVHRLSLFQYLIGSLYRKIRGWSSPRVIGSYTDV